jgi:hypothetical protein
VPRWIPVCAAVVLALQPVRAQSPQTRGATAEPQPRLEKQNPSPDPSKYKDVKDSQGNRYKVDEDGNVFTNGIPNPRRQPASVENVVYYYNYAVDMMNKGYTAPALEVYREILALPAKNELVVRAQEEARKNYDQVRSFRDNAQKLDDLLFVVRHVEDGRVIYENEKYHFRVRYPVNWTIEDEARNLTIDPETKDGVSDSYASLFLQPLPLPAPDGGKVSVAIGFHADRLRKPLSVERYRDHWVGRLRAEAERGPERLSGLKRQPQTGRPGTLRDRFEMKMDGQQRKGDDVFVTRGQFAYYLTFTSTPETYEAARDLFDRFLEGFEALP